MKVEIKKIREGAVLPEYQTPGSAAFDFTVIEEITILPKGIERIPTGLVIKTPPDHALILASRSSSPQKKGINLANSIGIIDSDYCGPGDEIQILVQNLREKPVTLLPGDRIAQGFIIPIVRAEFEEVSEISAENRGGFGSTGS